MQTIIYNTYQYRQMKMSIIHDNTHSQRPASSIPRVHPAVTHARLIG